jgi:hypothetical protein
MRVPEKDSADPKAEVDSPDSARRNGESGFREGCWKIHRWPGKASFPARHSVR